MHSSTPSSNGSGVYLIGPEQVLKAHISYMKKWPKCPWFPLLLYGLLSQPAPISSWSSLLSVGWWEEEHLGLVYRWFCTIYRHHPKQGSYSTKALFWDSAKGQRYRKILPVGRTLSSTSAGKFCLEGKMARCMIVDLFMVCGGWFGWIGQGLGRNTTEKLVTRTFVQEVCG